VAEPWKNSYGPAVVEWVADGLAEVHPQVDVGAFTAACLDGFDELELLDRARRIADVMADHLPSDPHIAIPLVAAAMGPIEAGLRGMTPFRYMPHGVYIATRGLPAFEESMAAQYELTKRFTAEFSIRPFLAHEQRRTLERLRTWTEDPDENVRRLVSEGTRPRLPWAPRLAGFVADPAPVLELLELLRDDSSEYVRRSVANNLNDIGKDHPELLVELAGRWWADGDAQRRRLVRHALRTLVKNADPAALEVLGIGSAAGLRIAHASVDPRTARIGQKVRIEVDVVDTRGTGAPRPVAVDVVVHFVKANGSPSAKVFKGGLRDLAAGQVGRFSVVVSLAQHSTRTHYVGEHRVEAQVNGARSDIGAFRLEEA
jgi:3-methyladenine DNA glycosylase AlkC